ncbi:hypothetical protein [Micromonospora psammae]|uniref:hypothetical protein n=1 Tax=Micromonospora sp. CPCC 205556 TaxID=3122398 RepID=UPI002FF0C0C0
MVVEKVRQAEARSERIAKAVEAAGDAFWATIAAAFPEATAGDFPPDATMDIERAQHQAVHLWLHYNAPEGGIAATGPASLPTVPDGRYGYVEWATHDESARGKWLFQLADTVTDLHAAWTAAVDDFADDLAHSPTPSTTTWCCPNTTW